MSATGDCLVNKRAFAAGQAAPPAEVSPARRIAVVIDMDARLHTRALPGLDDGDAYVIGNAGGVVTTDGVRSLTLSQRLQATREMMLVQHTDCGMLKLPEEDLKRAPRMDPETLHPRVPGVRTAAGRTET